MNSESAVSKVFFNGLEREAENARAHFVDMQSRQLAFYGADAVSLYVETARPKLRVHLLKAGRGEPVLILHGGDGEAVTWAPLIAHLQGDAELYVVDRPGFGLTDPFDYRSVPLREHAADFVVSVLDALGLESATVIGGSMGGFFALSAALACPARVRKLVLVGMAVGLCRSATLPLRIICGVPGLSRLFMRKAASLKGQHQQYRDMFHVDPSTVPDLYFHTRLAGLAMPGAKKTWAVLLRRVAGLRGMRPEVCFGDKLSNLQPKTLVLWGEHDLAPVAEAEAASSTIPRCKFVMLPGIGHFPFLETPVTTARLIREFVAG